MIDVLRLVQARWGGRRREVGGAEDRGFSSGASTSTCRQTVLRSGKRSATIRMEKRIKLKADVRNYKHVAQQNRFFLNLL